MEEKITLSDAIEDIREEIELAIKKGEGKPVKFLLNEIELELGVEVQTRSAKSGKANIVVVDLSGERAKTDTNIHRIKIKLTPANEYGALFISGERQRPK